MLTEDLDCATHIDESDSSTAGGKVRNNRVPMPWMPCRRVLTRQPPCSKLRRITKPGCEEALAVG